MAEEAAVAASTHSVKPNTPIDHDIAEIRQRNLTVRDQRVVRVLPYQSLGARESGGLL
jgi:hypothetical protein